MKKVIVLLITLLILSLCTPSNAAKKSASKRTFQPRASIDYAALAKKVLPSLVRITTDKYAGSGFFVSSTGDILTNYHVIEGARKITVLYSRSESVSASVEGVDIERDIALLSINPPQYGWRSTGKC